MDARPLVLIADDEAAATRLAARNLAREGFDVSTVDSGASAIERVWELNPDVLLLDVVMPGMSGIDYVRKPFSAPELSARIRAVLRRRRRLRRGRRRLGNAVVDLDRGRLFIDGDPVDPSRKEWLILERLLEAEGGIVTHDELLTAAFGPAYIGDADYLRLWIGQLRRRLGVPAWKEGPIRAVSGLGYALDLSGDLPERSHRPRSTAPRTGRQRR